MVTIKIAINISLKFYHMLWMYSIRRNLFKLICVSMAIDAIYIIVSLFPKVVEYTGMKPTIVLVMTLLEFAYLVITRFSYSVYLNFFII